MICLSICLLSLMYVLQWLPTIQRSLLLPFVQLVQRKVNQLAAEVSTLANIHRMALNGTKTKSMLVSSPRKLNTLLSQSLNGAVNDNKVEQVTEA